MDAVIRKPFQGLRNIMQFNWHFYIIAGVLICIFIIVGQFLKEPLQTIIFLSGLLISLTIALSLAVSFYVYDCSDLYSLNWLASLGVKEGAEIVNIHAGFDETSALIFQKFPQSIIHVFDFYEAEKHTEISIKRARKAMLPFPGTLAITTSELPLREESVDFIFAILAAHEIRNSRERIQFFQNLEKSLRRNGKIVVVEHLRDLPNFIAYNIGFLHFLSKWEWKRTFKEAGLRIKEEKKITAFISTFILEKNGTTS
jgi:SAM-dependent methyltransferase